MKASPSSHLGAAKNLNPPRAAAAAESRRRTATTAATIRDRIYINHLQVLCGWPCLLAAALLGAAAVGLVVVAIKAQLVADADSEALIVVNESSATATTTEPTPEPWKSIFMPANCWEKTGVRHCLRETSKGSGQWIESDLSLAAADGVTKEACKALCREHEDVCYFVLYNQKKKTCRVLTWEQCNRWRNGGGGDSILFTDLCPSHCRKKDLRCSGRVVNFETARSYAECGHRCEVHNLENAKEKRGGGNFTARGDCEWFSHHQGGECRLFSSCPRVVTPVEGWTTGEAVCVEEEHK